MVAKISVGKSLYGALAYNGEKINKEQGKLLTTNKIYNDGTGTVDINRAVDDFKGLYACAYKGGETGDAHLPQPASRRCADRYGIAGHRKGVSGKTRLRRAAVHDLQARGP